MRSKFRSATSPYKRPPLRSPASQVRFVKPLIGLKSPARRSARRLVFEVRNRYSEIKMVLRKGLVNWSVQVCDLALQAPPLRSPASQVRFVKPLIGLKSPVRRSARRLVFEVRNRYSEIKMVLRKGLEPLHLAAHAPQACVSTNSTT